MKASRARSSCGGLLLLMAVLPPGSMAQYVPPRVEADLMIAANKYPHLETDDVAVADCLNVYKLVADVRSEEIGTIRVTAYTPWYQTAEHLAREKAGQLGSNCLSKQYSSGLEGVPASYPFQISYRAFRMTKQTGFGSLGYWIPISRNDMSPVVRAADNGPDQGRNRNEAVPQEQPGHEHLWSSGNFIYRYEIGMDTSKFTEAVWEDIAKDFKEYFPPSEYRRLLEAHREKAKVLVDFQKMRITVDR